MVGRFTYPEMDDKEREHLIRDAQSASAAAAEAETELVRRYLPLVRSLSRPLYLWGWDSEDFIQEGTLGLIKAIRSYDKEKSPYFGVYAKVCILNQLKKTLEGNLRKKDIPGEEMTSLDGEEGDYLQDRTLPEMDEAIICKDEMERRLNQLLSKCSPFEREVLSAYLEGLSLDEIANKLNTTKRTVQNAMYRNRKKSEDIQDSDGDE